MIPLNLIISCKAIHVSPEGRTGLSNVAVSSPPHCWDQNFIHSWFLFSLSFLFYEQQIVPDDIVEEDGDQPNDKGAKSVQNLLNATKLVIVYSFIDLIIILL